MPKKQVLPARTALLRLGDVAFLAALAALVLYTVSKHEPWADEAQSWLIARDLGWVQMVFGELRYEGHPALWYSVLWPLIHICKMPYAGVGYVGAAFGIAGLAVLVLLAPFPRWLRYLIATSFFFVYQYAVIARSYNLTPLLAFSAAYFWRRGTRYRLGFAVAVAVLIQVSIYAAFLALCLATFCAFRVASKWSLTPAEERSRVVRSAALIAVSAAFFLIVVYPPPNTVAMAEAASLPVSVHFTKMFSSLFAAFADSIYVALPFLLVALLWARRRSGLALLISSLLGTAALFGFLRGVQHHVGLILLALVVSMWMVWPGPEDLHAIDDRRIHWAFLVSLGLMFAYQLNWSYHALRKDWAESYSGAHETAQYLRLVQADRKGCSGFTYSSVGVQAFFDHNIFENWGGPKAPAFYHNSLSFHERTTLTGQNLTSRYLVVGVHFPFSQTGRLVAIMVDYGYKLAFHSEGVAFFKNRGGEPQVYLVFERTADR